MTATTIQIQMARPGLCAGCGEPIEQPKGRRKWCSERCRKRTLYSGTCVDCGAATYNGTVPPPKRCHECNGRRGGELSRRAAEPHRAEVEAAWAAGLTTREMCERFGWTGKYSYTNIGKLRARGYDLPHRRTPEQLARIAAGADERMAKARAARRSAT